MFDKEQKVIGNEPKDYDKLIIYFGIILIILFWIIIGLTLYFTNSAIVQPLSTIILATIAVIATFQNEIRNWWKRPKIKIIATAQHSVVENNDMKYFRVKVRNFGKGSAKDCYVRLTQGLNMSNYSSFTDPMNLRWAGAFAEENQEKHDEKREIPPREGRDFFDLFIIQPVLKKEYDYVLKFGDKKTKEEIINSLKEIPPKEKYVEGKFLMYLVGSRGIRELELGGPDYLIYITLHMEGDYSKNFVLKIHNSKDSNEIRIEKVLNPKTYSLRKI